VDQGGGLLPRRVRQLRPDLDPLYLGGESDHTLRRVVEYCNGWFPRARGGFEPKGAAERLKKAAEAAKRDPKTLGITVFGAPIDAAALAPYRQAGIERVLFAVPDAGRDETMRMLDKAAAVAKAA
jgi:alkanesulfonate monooxygenase SsuD/methylene tetrahydromethanopterin reductase-like flavin-dependent oxidoreductase (luciferase family)